MPLPWLHTPEPGVFRGKFLVPDRLPERLSYREPLRRRLRVRFAGEWIADSEHAVLLHAPGRFPVAYFPAGDVRVEVLEFRQRTTVHPDLGRTAWYAVRVGDRVHEGAAWQHVRPPEHAADFANLVAFSWRAMDGFQEEDEPVTAHAADPYHRIDVRGASREVVVSVDGRVVAKSRRPRVLYESDRDPQWYLPRADVDETLLRQESLRTTCPYKGVATYYTVGRHAGAAWSYVDAIAESAAVADFVAFDPNKVVVQLDGKRLHDVLGRRGAKSGLDRAFASGR
ncbi:DUF427 domain-containing protein [Amycolatopsis rhabdoformis]|uniref:DUF427 domain-containing protein n=1 Tax=Amycolatopsis rhabdoformis TaxID=1448059 RepID=A0ABZ1HXA6_9PSEU|nr:DUF427 domain-containing protein [Amycolatopsis rhabdoformis]WSE26241.1 DUF427 domain-containing protein [Amycolatopsis rhabdoformis]